MTRVHAQRVSFRTGTCCALAAVAVLGSARLAVATVVRAVDFADQCATAETIVVATVRDVTSQRVAAAPAFFETLVTFAVDDVVAGNAPGTLTVRLAGGQIGDVRQSIDGMPEFAGGERYVLFLEHDQSPPLLSPIVGFNQGLYRVERVDDHDVVRDRSGRSLSGTAAAALAGTSGPAARSAPAIGRGTPDAATAVTPSLDEFIAAVRAVRPR